MNSKEFMLSCLNSLKGQCELVGKLILVDNNSNDGTREIVEDWILGNRRFNALLVHEPVQGAPAARNRGLRLATSEFVQFLDSDDILLPGKIASQLNLFHRMNETVGCICAGCYSELESIVGYELILPDENPVAGLFWNRAGNTTSNLWRREAIWRSGGWDEGETSSQEYLLMTKLVINGFSLIADCHPRAVHVFRKNQISDKPPMVLFQQRMKLYSRLARMDAVYFERMDQGAVIKLNKSIASLYSNDPVSFMAIIEKLLKVQPRLLRGLTILFLRSGKIPRKFLLPLFSRL